VEIAPSDMDRYVMQVVTEVTGVEVCKVVVGIETPYCSDVVEHAWSLERSEVAVA